MKLSRFTLPFLATGAGLTLALSIAPAGQAGQCVLANMVNNCAKYNETLGPSPTSVSYKFFDSKIATNEYFQFEANSNLITEFTISGQPNNPYTVNWMPSGGFFLSDIYTIATDPMAPIGSAPTISFEIPHDTFGNLEKYSFSLASNSDGSTMADFLVITPATNGFFSTRDSLRDDSFPPPTVPGPLPILGVGLAFGYSRSLRNRISASRVIL